MEDSWNACYGSASILSRAAFMRRPWYRLILHILYKEGLSLEGNHVLEVGCGFGGFSGLATEMGAEVVGVDVSSLALRTAKQEPAMFLACDGRRLPFSSAKFDFVVCSEVLEHVSGCDWVLHELARVVKTKGYVVITVPNLASLMMALGVFVSFENRLFRRSGQPRDINFFTFSILDKYLRCHGFRVVRRSGFGLLYVYIPSARILRVIAPLHKPHELLAGLCSTIGVIARKI